MTGKTETKNVEFIAQASEARTLIAVVALGMCRAVSSGTVSTAYACHRLFGPALVACAKRAGATPDILEALNLGRELEDVEDLAPDAFRSSLDDLEARLVNALREIGPRVEDGERWLLDPHDV